MNFTSTLRFLIINGLFLYAAYYIKTNAVPGEIRWTVAAVVLTVWWAARLIFAGVNKYKAVKEKTKGDISLKNIDQVGAATIPEWLLGYYETEKKMYLYFWRTLTFAPVKASAGYRNQIPASHAIKAVLKSAVAIGLCAWGGKALLDWLGTGTSGIVSAVTMGLLALYLLVWILGDWRGMRDIGQQLGAQTLDLSLGVRGEVSLPLSSIASMRVTSGVPAAGSAVLMLSGASDANVLVELHEEQELKVLRYGYPAPVRAAAIALKLEKPQAFIDSLKIPLLQAAPRVQQSA